MWLIDFVHRLARLSLKILPNHCPSSLVGTQWPTRLLGRWWSLSRHLANVIVTYNLSATFLKTSTHFSRGSTVLRQYLLHVHLPKWLYLCRVFWVKLSISTDLLNYPNKVTKISAYRFQEEGIQSVNSSLGNASVAFFRSGSLESIHRFHYIME